MPRPITRGRLNRRVRICTLLDVPNGMFGLTTTEDAGLERWAAIDPVGSLQHYGAKQTGTEITDHITFVRGEGTLPEDFSTDKVIEERNETTGKRHRYRVVRAVDLAGEREYTMVEALALEAVPL